MVQGLPSNPEVNSDTAAMLAASAALAVSGGPFAGPIGAARVGYIDGQYVLNPNAAQMPSSKLDLVVAGTDQAVLMVESEAQELPEDVMLGAVVFGHEQMQVAIDAINELVFDGLFIPRQYSPLSVSPQAYPKQAEAHIEYDVDQANALLDGACYAAKNADGLRVWPVTTAPITFIC